MSRNMDYETLKDILLEVISDYNDEPTPTMRATLNQSVPIEFVSDARQRIHSVCITPLDSDAKLDAREATILSDCFDCDRSDAGLSKELAECTIREVARKERKGSTANFITLTYMKEKVARAKRMAVAWNRLCNTGAITIRNALGSEREKESLLEIIIHEFINYTIFKELDITKSARVPGKREELADIIIVLIVLYLISDDYKRMRTSYPENGASEFYWICSMVYQIICTHERHIEENNARVPQFP